MWIGRDERCATKWEGKQNRRKEGKRDREREGERDDCWTI